MPYTETLKDQMIGNTLETILECLCFLYNESSRSRAEQYKVSIVYGRGKEQISLGDDLELANPNTNKVRKKRWWERNEKPTDQLRLPFPSYQPAKIIGMYHDHYEDAYDLQIQYKDNNATCQTVTKFSARRGLRGGSHNIKAIKIHRVIQHWVADEETITEREEIRDITRSPFHDSFYRQEQPGRHSIPSRETCISLLSRAVENGIIVTQTQIVYDKETGEQIGHDIVLDRENQSPPIESLSGQMYSLVQRYHCSMKMADGENYACLIDMSKVEHVDTDNYIPPPSLSPSLYRHRWAEGFNHGGVCDESSFTRYHIPPREGQERMERNRQFAELYGSTYDYINQR